MKFFPTLLLSVLFFPSNALVAQTPGTGNSSVSLPGIGHDYIEGLSERVDPASGSLRIDISVPVPSGRGPKVPFGLVYDSSSLVHEFGSAQLYAANGEWSNTIPTLTHQQLSFSKVYANHTYQCTYSTDWKFHDSGGRKHALGVVQVSPTFPCNSIGSKLTGGDVSLRASMESNLGFKVADAAGMVYTFPWGTTNATVTVEDPNGNVILINRPTASSTAFTETDTVGRTILSLSGFGGLADTLDTLSVSGLSVPYQINWQSVGYNFSTDWTLLQQTPGVRCYPQSPAVGSGKNVSTITLPNGKQDAFQYDSTSGLLSRVTYPSGGWVSYSWSVNARAETEYFPDQAHLDPNGCLYRFGQNALSVRSVSFDGVTTALKQTFQYSTVWPSTPGVNWTSKQSIVTTQDLVRGSSFTTTTSYLYAPLLSGEPKTQYFQNPPSLQDMNVPAEQAVAYADSTSATIRTVNKSWYNAQQLASETVTLDGGLQMKTSYTYAPGAQLTEKDEYGFGATTATRKTITNYQSFAPTLNFPGLASIFNRPCQTVVYDGAGNRAAETDYFYDNGATTTPCGTAGTPSVTGAGGTSLTGHDAVNYSASSTGPRGNLTTKIGKCLQTGCIDAIATYTYDETGQTLSTVDPNGNAPGGVPAQHTATLSYADSYSSGTPPGSTNAYLTQVTDALGHSASFKYAYGDGQLTSSTDANSQVTSYTYNTPPTGCSLPDGLDRLSEIDEPNGGKISNCYNDATFNTSTPSPSVAITKAITSSLSWASTVASDGIGHTVKSILLSDTEGADTTDTTYDGLGRIRTQTNPHRAASAYTDGTTSYSYDALGRMASIFQPDGSTVTTAYSGNCTTVTDEAGNSRKSCSDGLGRLTQVFEDPGSAPHLNYETDYQYDMLDNLLRVDQVGGSTNSVDWRTRTFTYDSLSRLLCAANPEVQPVTCPVSATGTFPAGAITYTYDANGNMLTKTAPAPNQTGTATVTTTYSYDALNRLTAKSYSDGTTPANIFNYDVAPAWMSDLKNTVGRLTNTGNQYAGGTSGKATATTYSYDAMGRVIREWQQTPSVAAAGSFTYNSYDLAGNLSSATDTTGTTISYTHDAASRLASVTSSWIDAQHPATLWSVDPTQGYYPHGALKKATFGNGLTESAVIEPRLQICRLNLSTAGGAPTDCNSALPSDTIQSYQYAFGVWGSTNSGNITAYAASGKQSFNRSYSYDKLNRLQSMTDSASGQPCKGLSWTIDAWGNMTQQTPTNGTCLSLNVAVGTNNRFQTGYTYDAAGNLTNDGQHSYTYDAENRIVGVDGGSTASYIYNENGKRVRKNKGSGWTEYFYGPNGAVQTELVNGAWGTRYVYGGSGLLAEYTNGTTEFVHSDHLGSTRLVTGLSKQILDCLDYLPFGQQINSSPCFAGAATSYKFTGKERDSESGLDNFEARYDASSLGRFMTPDPVVITTERMYDPQQLNGYAYV